MVRRLKESNPYPSNWTADTDIHKVFSVLDQTDTKNPGSIEDLYGFVEYDVGWVDGEEDIIQIRATMSGKGYGSYETFYVYPSYTKNVYLIDTEELGTRTVGNATDVWDIMSTCLSDQLKGTSSASVYEESITEDFDDEYDEEDYDEEYDKEFEESSLDSYTINLLNEFKYTYNPDEDFDYFLYRAFDEDIAPEDVIEYLTSVDGWQREAAEIVVNKGPYPNDLDPEKIESLDTLFQEEQNYCDFADLAIDNGFDEKDAIKYLVHQQGVPMHEVLEELEII